MTMGVFRYQRVALLVALGMHALGVEAASVNIEENRDSVAPLIQGD